MKLSYRIYHLQLAHTFTVSGFSRNTSPVVLTEIHHKGLTGYGEASMPPYLGESPETVTRFLSKVNLNIFDDPFEVEAILNYIDLIEKKNTAAKASIDIALHDLIGKMQNKPLYELWGIDSKKTPFTSYTIGIDKPKTVKIKTLEAKQYKVLKVKLGGDNDKEMIKTIRSITKVPLYVDANQGWTDKYEALDRIHWLNEYGVQLIEQPMPKNQINDMAWLTEKSPLPTIADEAFQRLEDIDIIKGAYTGINIKLTKSTGLNEARKMIQKAKKLDLKVMLGCMTETSCAISAAAQLSPLVDWADLDGNLLITNDVFDGMKIEKGKVKLKELPGIGITKIKHKI
jgi:L-alanine-DL-glutamate epimerase-like enolase superfamily enzyme